MDDQWRLPETIELGGEEYDIRTDFRAILDILKAASDPELSDSEKAEVMIKILYWDYEEIPVELLDEAAQKGKEFIDCGITSEGKSKVQLMDWEQDSPIIAPAVNKNIGKDIRSMKYMHWWTFLYGDCRRAVQPGALHPPEESQGQEAGEMGDGVLQEQ